MSAWGDGPGDPIPYGPPTDAISHTFDCEPGPYIVSYDAPSYTGNEGRSVNPIVSITPTPNRSITVGLTATTGTTESGDYTRTATQARFNATTTSVGFDVNFADDNDCDDEDFSLGFSGLPDDVETGTQAAPTVAIEDDDNCVVNISASPTNPAENSNVTVTVSIPSNSPVSNRSLSIPVVVAAGTAEAGDYSVSGLPVTISPGSRSATFTISVSEDALEDCENDTVIARFGARRDFPDNVVTGSSTSVTIVIQDDEPTRDCQYVVTYDRSSYRGDEGDSVSPMVSITPTPNRSITVGLTATTGTTESGDYTRTATQARFNATTTSVRFNVNFADDNDCDDEDFSLGFSGLPDDVETGTQAAPDVDIDDLDTCKLKFSSGSDISLTEGGSARSVTVEFLDGITTDRQVTVPIDVRGSGAYSFTGLNSQDELVFSANARSDSFNIAAGQDADCDNESLTLELGSPAPSDVRLSTPNEVGANITDDDDCVTVPVQRAPAPTGLAVDDSQNTKTSIRLSWNSVPNAHRYKLENQQRSPRVGSWTNVGSETASTNKTATGLLCGTRYQFRVSARGDGSPYSTTYGITSGVVSHSTEPCEPPPAPTGLHGNGNIVGNEVKVWWDWWAGVDSYDLRYAVDCVGAKPWTADPACDHGPYTQIDDITGTEQAFNVGGTGQHVLTKSVAYRVEVRATNSAGDSNWSTRAIIVPTDSIPRFSAPADVPRDSRRAGLYPFPATMPLHGYQAKSGGIPELTYGVCSSTVPTELTDRLSAISTVTAADVASGIVTAVENWETALERTSAASLISVRDISSTLTPNDCIPPSFSPGPLNIPVGKNPIIFTDDRIMNRAACSTNTGPEGAYPSCFRAQVIPNALYDDPEAGPVGVLPEIEGGWIMLREGLTERGDPGNWARVDGVSPDICRRYEHRIMHEVGHALGLGRYQQAFVEAHGNPTELALMTAGETQWHTYYCLPQAYDIGALMVNYQSR